MHILIFLLAATLYRVEPVNGTVEFSILKWGVFREQGTFRDFEAKIVYDKQDPKKSSVAFDVDVRSVDTKNENRDGTLRSVDFFDAAKHPKMTFRSVAVVPRGKGLANVTGDLTIRGVTKRITVPVRLTGEARNGRETLAAFETTFTVDRRAFNVTGGRWIAGSPGILANDVTIRIVAGGVAR
jgi:polyisoprenoid-binding protein YceI